MSAAPALALRPVRHGELPELLDMLRRFYVEDRIPLDEPRVRRGLEQLLADAALGAVLFAEAEGERVGYLVLGWCFSIEQGGRHVLVDELYLEPAARGRGLGAALLAAACDWARGQGAEVARLEVNRHNPRAKALYLRHGFRDDDRDILSLAFAGDST
ncbi:N-acetyltransferase [Luteimonas padinae]|uniref:GNAT family N-acetyltransferase n=1 Tax=Luteimonas padinae TaxID=1714359 RepID=A0ABV6T0S3_9GAMM|nr:GNAT family N-acetyltransferase [Luteimonas padinae]GHD66639.1 N-acetyltransferase [Luteimonas padinae]